MEAESRDTFMGGCSDVDWRQDWQLFLSVLPNVSVAAVQSMYLQNSQIRKAQDLLVEIGLEAIKFFKQVKARTCWELSFGQMGILVVPLSAVIQR